MKVSILTPTQPSRKAFWPWMSYVMQGVIGATPKEIWVEWVIAGVGCTSYVQFHDGKCIWKPSRGGYSIKQIPSAPTLGETRQALLDAATGDVIAWVDDDDWHHPERITTALQHLDRLDAVFFVDAHYVQLETGRGVSLRTQRMLPMPMSFVGKTDFARSRVFEALSTGEDVAWAIPFIAEPFRVGNLIPGVDFKTGKEDPPLWAALSHRLSTTAGQQSSWRFDLPPEKVDELLGPAWVAARPQIEALRARLAQL